MEEINPYEMNSYNSMKRNRSFLPDIKLNYTAHKEIGNKFLETNNNSYQNINNYIDFKNNNGRNKKEKIRNYNNILHMPYTNDFTNDNHTLKKYNSQMNLFNNDHYIINHTQSNEGDFSNFFGNIKISNFYSSAEIILLIENILNELNFKKNYSFTIKDSLITFSFRDANKALAIFKKLNMEKANNIYYRNLIIDINLDLKNNKSNKEIIEPIKKPIKKENKLGKGKMIIKMISPRKNKSQLTTDNNDNNMIKNLKSHNASKDNWFEKNFEGIYKDYLEYFKKKKEQRRKKELSYVNGNNYSLQASSPYVENDNRNYFRDNLRKYKGDDISPSKFNGYFDKASFKKV